MTSMAALTAGVNRSGQRGSGTRWSARCPDHRTSRRGPVRRGLFRDQGRPVLAAAGPGRPGGGRGMVRVGRHRAEDRVRAGLPAAGHLAVAAPGPSITLPVGVEAYAAYALRAWLAGGHRSAAGPAGSPSGPRSAPSRSAWPNKRPTTCWPRPGMLGSRGPSPRSCPACRSWSWPWYTTLAHMLRADAGTAADAPDNGTGGPAVSRSPAWSAEDQAGAAQDQAAPQAPLAGSGPSAGTSDGPAAGPRRQGGNGNPVRHRPGTRGRQQACSSGKAGQHPPAAH